MIKIKYSFLQKIVPLLIVLLGGGYCWFNVSMIREFGFSSPRLVFGTIVSVILLAIATPLTVYRVLFHVYLEDEKLEIQEWFFKREYRITELEQVMWREKTSGIQFTPESFFFRGGRERMILRFGENTISLVYGMNGYDTLLHHFCEEDRFRDLNEKEKK